jgi:ABC-type uncharacterized transport system substrate-binding protein
VDGGPQHPDRHSLGSVRRKGDATFATELVTLQPDLILSPNAPTTAALLRQTRTIPIVFTNITDPVGSGFVASFPRPGGNVTGFVNMEPTMAGKWLELLKAIAPRVNRAAILFNPSSTTQLSLSPTLRSPGANGSSGFRRRF